ncbi:MAG: copper chaperone [Pseudanabaenaceae cyanobacterium bins.39]|nr:copper chaperone [Pseudanabaenaceae cyanobacterium bins.39]
MSLTLLVPSIGCSSCIETITKTIHTVDTSAKIIGNLEQKSLCIDSKLTESKLRELIAIAGHEVS